MSKKLTLDLFDAEFFITELEQLPAVCDSGSSSYRNKQEHTYAWEILCKKFIESLFFLFRNCLMKQSKPSITSTNWLWGEKQQRTTRPFVETDAVSDSRTAKKKKNSCGKVAKGDDEITKIYLVCLHHEHLFQFQRFLCGSSQPVFVYIFHSPQLALPEAFLFLINSEDNLFIVFHGLTQVGQLGVTLSQSNLKFHDSRV